MRWQQGFSLVEVTIVLAISAILAVGVTAGINSTREENAYLSQVDEIKNTLEKQRAEAYSAITDDGTGSSSSKFFGRILEFDPASPYQIQVSDLIASDKEQTAFLSKCPRSPIALNEGIRYNLATRTAIIFTRQPDSTFAVRDWDETAGTGANAPPGCTRTAYVPDDLYGGSVTPPAGGGGPSTPSPLCTTDCAPPSSFDPPRTSLAGVYTISRDRFFYFRTTNEEEARSYWSNPSTFPGPSSTFGRIYSTQVEDSKPLYRYRSVQGAYFYTTDPVEGASVSSSEGFANPIIIGYVLKHSYNNTRPLVRLHSSVFTGWDTYYIHTDPPQIAEVMSGPFSFGEEEIIGYVPINSFAAVNSDGKAGSSTSGSRQAASFAGHSQSSPVLTALGIHEAHAAYAYTKNILDPANYNHDNDDFSSVVQLNFRIENGTASRLGIVTVQPRNNVIRRRVQ